ncbi:MAG: secreted trypsin-like serine protease [Myxococcota bacterium]|jgi:secreted trypsin-like serine protease
MCWLPYTSSKTAGWVSRTQPGDAMLTSILILTAAADENILSWEAAHDVDLVGESLRELTGEAVVGGEQAELGVWDDTAGIVFSSSYVGCTGVLIAPDLVLTAGHCYGGISHVLLGSTDWYGEEGDFYEVKKSVKYGDVYDGVDITLLILESETDYEPRIIATDCILDDHLVDGAEVAVVGYGNTLPNGNGDTSELNEGFTVVQDHDCSEDYIEGIYTGCNPAVSPGGEIAAGGNGVDACFGDSGGPLYLMTDEGAFLVGITSRAYAGAPGNAPCYYGGIYGRPDYIIDWIEEESGQTLERPQCNNAPEVSAANIEVGRGDQGSTRIQVADPDGDEGGFTYTIVKQPTDGTAWVNGNGKVTYDADRFFSGTDRIVVEVTDAGSPEYAASGPLSNQVKIKVTAGGLGCTTAPGPRGSAILLLLLAPLAVFRRR